MGNTLSVTDDYYFTGNVRFKNAPTFPNAAIAPSELSGPIPASLLERVFNLAHTQTGTVVAATEYKRIVRGSTATLLAVQAAITEAIATDPSRTVSIDLQRSTGGGAFASVLAAPISFGNTDTLRAVKAAGLTTTAFVLGDILKIVVTVAGSSGSQAQGLAVNVDLTEDPV